jgi:hypothetical protein
MHHRLICAILAALMPLLLAAPAFAQEGTPAMPVLCGDLADEDCAILEEAMLAGQDITAYAMDMQMDFSMGGIPDMPVDPMAFNMQIVGRFAFNAAGQELLQKMHLLQTPSAAETMQALMEQMPELVLDLYRGMNLDMTLAYTLPAELAAALSEDSDVAVPEELSFDIRMIDGMMYMNVGQLRDLIPESDDTLTSDWIGFDYVGMLEMQMENNTGAINDSMAAGAMGGLAVAQMMQNMQEFITVERVDDVELDGQQGAVFVYTPDIVGFFSSDAFVDMLSQMSAMMGEEGPSATEMEEAGTMLSFVAPMVFRDLEIESRMTIGLDDYRTYATEFSFRWDLASLMQFAAMTDPALADAMGDAEPLIEMNAAINMSDFNSEMEFAAPDDVQIIPLEEMMPVDTSTIS